MSQTPTQCDVLILGAGPAGATAGALLAQMGRRVVILEKQPFPRYRIGESLLPYCYFPLKRLGLIEKINEAGFTKKYSVQFVGTSGNVSQPFYFFEHMNDHPASQTWQVERSRFDQMLLDHALHCGAELASPMTAKRLLANGSRIIGVEAADTDDRSHTFHAAITIDATGRDALSIKQFDWRVRDPQLNKTAVWTYFKGAKRDAGYDEGATTVAYLPNKGWFWHIPLCGDMVSVGAVAQKNDLFDNTTDPAEIIRRQIALNPWMAERLVDAKQVGEYHVTADFSYRAKHCAADGLVLAGDAFAFLDPVFSSGVFLALKSGEMAADAVDAALTADDTGAVQFTEYGQTLCDGVEAMRKLVYAFYDQTFRFGDLLRQYPHLRGDLTDCLIGNLFRDFDPLFDAVAQFADVPPPLPHGRPLAAADAPAIRSSSS